MNVQEMNAQEMNVQEMNVQEVILRAVGQKIMWYDAEIISIGDRQTGSGASSRSSSITRAIRRHLRPSCLTGAIGAGRSGCTATATMSLRCGTFTRSRGSA